MKNRLLAIMTAFLMSASVGLGFAQWNFTAPAESDRIVNVVVGDWAFKMAWLGSDKISDDAYDFATDFEQAINNPNSPEGQAWTRAWNEKHTLGNSYVGSMDDRAGNDLDIVFDSNSTYIIKRSNNNEYYLYTYEGKINSLAGGRVQPVYRTYFRRNQTTGNYEAIQSWVGSCSRNIYSATQGLGTYAFDTESFREI